MKAYQVTLSIIIEAESISDAMSQLAELSASDLNLEDIEEC